MASGVEAKARRRASRTQKAASGAAGPGAASFETLQRTHVLLGDGSQVSAQQYINQHAVAGTVKVRVTGMGKQAVRTQESVDAEARLATFKPHKIIAYPFTGSGVEVGRIRQVRLKTNKSWAYSAGVPHGSGRTADIICDWFVLDAEASEKLRTEKLRAEDARLAALPHAATVESVLDTRRRRGGGDAEYLVKWKDYDASHNSWEPASKFDSWVNGCAALAAFLKLPPPPGLVYKKILEKHGDRCYYELVTKAEVLVNASIDDTDLDRAVITLRPEHSEQLARVDALARADESSDEQ